MNRQFGSAKSSIIFLVGSLIAVVLYWFRPQAETRVVPAPPPPVVSVLEAKLQRHQLVVTSQGSVIPSRSISLVAEVPGRVISVGKNFVDGGFFEKDEVLVKLDDRDYQYQLINANADIARARREKALEKGQARQAKRQWRDLGSQEANDLSLRRPQVKAAEAQLAAAIAQREQVKLNLQRTNIHSLFSGRVQKTHVDIGQYVTPGTVVAQVYDSALAEVRVPLTDQQMTQIGLPLGLELKESEQPDVTLSAAIAGVSYQWQAKLTRTEASVDTTTRLYIAIVEVPEPFNAERYNNPLVMGLFVDVAIDGRYADGVVRLPETAIVDKEWVFIVDEEGLIQQRSVTIVDKKRDQRWVRGSITAGEHIVISDTKVLRPGIAVTENIIKPQVID